MKALIANGSLRWSCRFSRGPLPVTMAWTKNPNMENIACKVQTVSMSLTQSQCITNSTAAKKPVDQLRKFRTQEFMHNTQQAWLDSAEVELDKDTEALNCIGGEQANADAMENNLPDVRS